MITCENCGAQIDETALECPYCHSAQTGASERKYMNDLYSMDENMDNMDDNAIRVELKTTLKHAFIMIGIFGVCMIIGAFIGTVEYKSYHDNSKERKQIISDYVWYDENIDYLNELYEKQDFETIYNMYTSDSSNSVGRNLRSWEHYAIYSLYSYNYRRLLSYMDDDLYTKYDSSYTSAYRASVEFMTQRAEYLSGSSYYGKLTQEDAAISEKWVDTVTSFVRNELKITDAEFEEDIRESDSYSYEDYKQKAAVYFERVRSK